jgi:hypothetical protein
MKLTEHYKPEAMLSLKSHIVHLKTVGPGFRVSYGSTFITGRETESQQYRQVMLMGSADYFHPTVICL